MKKQALKSNPTEHSVPKNQILTEELSSASTEIRTAHTVEPPEHI